MNVAADMDDKTLAAALLEANVKIALNQWQIAGFLAITVFCVLMLVDPMHHAAEWLFGLTG